MKPSIRRKRIALIERRRGAPICYMEVGNQIYQLSYRETRKSIRRFREDMHMSMVMDTWRKAFAPLPLPEFKDMKIS